MFEQQQPARKIIPLRTTQRGGDMTPLRDLMNAQREPTSPPPTDLYRQCDVCGLVAPFFVPFGRGRWVEGQCPCTKRRKEEQEQAEMRAAWAQVQRERTYSWLGRGWEDSGIDLRTFATFDASRQPQAYQAAQSFTSSPSNNFAIYGPFGTGKTHLAAAICNALRESGIASLFASAVKLHSSYLDKLNSNDDHWKIIKQAISTPVLVLDDIDKPKHTETREELYYMIFDERNKACRPIVLTTNRLDTLHTHIGEAACSRFMEGLTPVEVTGRDVREEM